jgi:hypothetical protein
LSRSAERETPMAFLFVSFFFAPLAAKEKAESAWERFNVERKNLFMQI